MSDKITETIQSLIEKGEMVVRCVDIDSVRESKNNPRKISKKNFNELKKSISDFPEMIRFRPGIVDKDGNLLAGNMRHRGCKALGWTKFWVMDASDLTPDQLKELMIRDNIEYGQFDNKMLKQDWDIQTLTEWGMDVNALIGNQGEPGEIIFSPELDQQSNYVLLKFDKDIDFLHIETILGLESVYAKRANGKAWAKGRGRVVDGITAIKSIKESNINL